MHCILPLFTYCHRTLQTEASQYDNKFALVLCTTPSFGIGMNQRNKYFRTSHLRSIHGDIKTSSSLNNTAGRKLASNRSKF